MQIAYNASPTGARLHASQKPVRGFLGPVGNGKSVCCINEGLRLSFDQWPNSHGIRKSRGVIVRNTGPELRTTVLNTWKQWVPESIAPIVLHPVITCALDQLLPDGTRVEMEIYFLALDNDRDVKKLLSLEATWIFLNEAKELPYSVVKAARERIGRYPAVIDGYQDAPGYTAPRDEHGNYQPCKRKALLMDTNPPSDDHWWYQLAEEGCLKTAKNKDEARAQVAEVFDFFRGPPPLIKVDGKYQPNPEAENVENLPGGYQYYFDMLAGNTDEHVNVMVLGNYGTIAEGRLVYPHYNDGIHCPERGAKAIKGLPIGLGWDFGLTPSLVVGQLTNEGQLRTVAELVAEDMDARVFARDHAKPFLDRFFKDFEIAHSYGDPAGNNRGEGEGKSAIGILNDEYIEREEDALNLGFVTEPAPTNDPTQRIDAVSRFMTRMVNGEPAYVLNRPCVTLRRAKQGGYCFKRVAIASAEGKFKDKPDKNKYSHASDAEQYMALGFITGYATMGNNVDAYEQDQYRPSSAMGY
jgi:hypothetical protein